MPLITSRMADDALLYRFDEFYLDATNRQLRRGDAPLELNGRYFDALVLLVRERGQLVHKDRFFSDVWGDVVVSDAALTQCIKEIRKQLGDDAANPRYVETVPRYGYRFIAPVSAISPAETRAGESASAKHRIQPAMTLPGAAASTDQEVRFREALLSGAAGTAGGAGAGVLGGLLYGFGLAYTPADPQLGSASVLLVLVSLTAFVGLIGGFGVSFGMAATRLPKRSSPAWSIAGAAFGGMFVGGLVKLLGIDAFTLLFGRAPAGITGGVEGAVLGAAVALGARLGGGIDAVQPWRPVFGAGLVGAAAGMLIPLSGGRLLGGSLELLARSFASSRLQLDALGRFFGEIQFGATTQIILGGIEGLLFSAGVVGAMVLASRATATSAGRRERQDQGSGPRETG